MTKTASFLITVSFCLSAAGQNRIEAGIGAGSSHPLWGSAFKSVASSGDGQNYWIGYGFNNNWGVELGLDQFDFDGADSKHKAYNLAAVHRFAAERPVHPILKAGISSVESKSAADVKTGSAGVKAAFGLEADFRYISIGALANYHFIANSDKALNWKNTQLFVPSVFLTVHNALDVSWAAKATQSTAPPAAEAVSKKDSDHDGIFDEDDKCPQTPAGVVVNAIGCSEKEKASVRLNIEFATGKVEILSQYESEVRQLADFMRKFPETAVEIAGHTDSRGSSQTNIALSQKRAEAVKEALIKSGVETSRLSAKGYGSSRPVADNATKGGREQNRRVTAEISVMTEKKK